MKNKPSQTDLFSGSVLLVAAVTKWLIFLTTILAHKYQ